MAKNEDQDFLDADFSNIMYEKYGKKWTEYQEQEVKRIEEEQLVSIDNVIFEPVPKRKTESAETFFDETIGVEYFVDKDTKKRPYPRDKYIYEDERFNSERDTIYLNKLGKTIEIISITFILLSLIGLLAVFVWAFN